MWDERYFPKIEDQCFTDTCVAWAVGYYAKTFFLYRDWVKADPKHSVASRGQGDAVSPSWVFNNINEGVDEGQAIAEAVVLLKVAGAALIGRMPITCDPARAPTAPTFDHAKRYRTASGRSPRKFRTAAGGPIDFAEVRRYLDREGPVVFMLDVDAGFSNPKTTRADQHRAIAYEPGDASVPDGATAYRHAICCTGYDPAMKIGDHAEGAYRFVNSYGPHWRDHGRVWIAESVLRTLHPNAYALEDDDAELAARPWDSLDGLDAIVRENAVTDAAKGASGIARDVTACRAAGDPERGCPILKDIMGPPVVFYDDDDERTIVGPWRQPASWFPTETVVRIVGADGSARADAAQWAGQIQSTRQTQGTPSADQWSRDVFTVRRPVAEGLTESSSPLYIELVVEMTRRDAQHRVANRRRYRVQLQVAEERPLRFFAVGSPWADLRRSGRDRRRHP